MSFETQTCVVLICDGGCMSPWGEDAEGIPHFADEAEAVKEATGYGWFFADGKALCARCHQKHLCDDTGHLYGEWHDEELETVKFRQRYCERCDHLDYDPPFAELYPRFQAIRDAEAVLRAVKP